MSSSHFVIMPLCKHVTLDQLKTYMIKSDFRNIQSMRERLSIMKRFYCQRINMSLCNHVFMLLCHYIIKTLLDQLKTYLIKSNFRNVQSMRKWLSVIKRFSGRRVEEVNDLLVVLIPDGYGVGTHRDLIKNFFFGVVDKSHFFPF